jgi:glutamate:GABA antiporter
MAEPAPKLRLFEAVLYGLALVTGMRWIAVAAAVGPSALPLWLLALLTFYVPLAAATAELSARFAGDGGLYVWTRDTLGPRAGFLIGWFYWVAQIPYFAGILYFLSSLILSAIGGDTKDTLAFMAISTAIAALVTLVQLGGLRTGKWLPNFGTAGGWVVLAIIVAMAAIIALRGEGATNFAAASYVPPASFDTAILWGTIVFAFCGAEALGFLRNEVAGGPRALVRILAAVGCGLAFLYIAGTVSFLVILPRESLTRLAGFPDALRAGLSHVGLGGLAPGVIGLFALSMLGGFAAWFGVAARLPFAAGTEAFLPPVFASRSPRTGAPVPAVLLQAACVLVTILISQAGGSVASAYDFLVAMSVLTATIPYVFLFAVYLKRASDRRAAVLGWTGQLATLSAIACTLVPNASETHPAMAVLKIVLSALAMAVLGMALYRFADRRRATAA